MDGMDSMDVMDAMDGKEKEAPRPGLFSLSTTSILSIPSMLSTLSTQSPPASVFRGTPVLFIKRIIILLTNPGRWGRLIPRTWARLWSDVRCCPRVVRGGGGPQSG